MKILFNNIPYINSKIEDKNSPSFRSFSFDEDKFIRSSQIPNESAGPDISKLEKAAQDLFDSIEEDDPVLKAIIFKKIQDEAMLSGFMSSLCDNKNFNIFQNNFFFNSIESFIRAFLKNSALSDSCLENFEKAKIKTCNDLANAVEIYKSPKVYDVYKNATIDFLEIYGQVIDREDILRYPELLLHIKDIFSDYQPQELTTAYSSFTSVLKFLEVKNTDHFKEKFKHLAPKFNDFATPHDVGLALIDIQENCEGKIELLLPYSSGKTQDDIINNACHLYAIMPDIVDTLYEENNGKSLGDFKDIFSLASSHENLYKRGLALVKPVFNDFNYPIDKIRFYRTLIKNDVSANDFKKLFSNQIISDMDQIQLFKNKQNIIDFISQKEKMNNSNATSFYYNFADILNVAYSSDNTSDILSETYSLIKNCKFKSSSDVLDFYNQCNINNGRAKSLTKDQFTDFIDLIRFVDKQDFKNPKKVKKIRLDDLRKTRDSFYLVKDHIEDFLLNRSNNLFYDQTPISIFLTCKNDLIGASKEQVEATLLEIDKLNIKNSTEKLMINQQIDRLQSYFPSRNDVLSFIVANEVSFDNSEDAQEYLLNCNKLLKSMYWPYNPESSHELIKKLSNLRFFINSKNSLNDLLSCKLDPVQTQNLLDTFVDKHVTSYSAFESFVNEYEVDDKSFDKLLNFIRNTPDKVTLGNVLFKIRNLKFALEKSGFPLSLNADNLTRLSYDDLSNCTTKNGEINLNVLNKLLGLKNNKNPVLGLPNVYAEPYVCDKNKIAFELLQVKAGSDSYPNLKEFLFAGKSLKDLSYFKIKNLASSIPNYFVDFVNTKFKTPDGQDYNMSLHAKLRIIERFLMDDVETKQDFLSDKTSQKLDELLNSIYNQEQLMLKNSPQGERLVFNSSWNGKVVETIFNKSGLLVTAVEKSYR